MRFIALSLCLCFFMLSYIRPKEGIPRILCRENHAPCTRPHRTLAPFLRLLQHVTQKPPLPCVSPTDKRSQFYLFLRPTATYLISLPTPPRSRSLNRHNSVFLYFPHVELVFLLFAYQGASVAEARMMRSDCLPLVILGACAMVREREAYSMGM